jgi:molybdopterin synthase sulfur carrier subunit
MVGLRMKITLRFFASLREALGASETLTLPAPTTVAQVRELLLARGEPYATALAPGRAVRCAINQTVCAGDQAVEEGAELAFFPPVTGG